MGLFNDYICKLAHGVACPGCGARLHEYQTKALDPGLLAKWVEGEKIDTGHRFTIRNGDFEAIGYCKTCKEVVYVVVPVEEGILGLPRLLGFKSREELAREAPEGKPTAPAPPAEPRPVQLPSVAQTYLLAIEGIAKEHLERKLGGRPPLSTSFMDRIVDLVHEYESLPASEKKED